MSSLLRGVYSNKWVVSAGGGVASVMIVRVIDNPPSIPLPAVGDLPAGDIFTFAFTATALFIALTSWRAKVATESLLDSMEGYLVSEESELRRVRAELEEVRLDRPLKALADDDYANPDKRLDVLARYVVPDEGQTPEGQHYVNLELDVFNTSIFGVSVSVEGRLSFDDIESPWPASSRGSGIKPRSRSLIRIRQRVPNEPGWLAMDRDFFVHQDSAVGLRLICTVVDDGQAISGTEKRKPLGTGHFKKNPNR
jgi:hypothetical protein